MTTGIIVQARMTSTRFPGKVLHMLAGKTVLERVLERAKLVAGADAVIVAFPADDASIPIYTEVMGIPGIFSASGSETDVLSRYYDAALKYGLDTIVRITSDCPFIDPIIISGLIAYRNRFGADYASNVFPRRTYPKGLDCEAFTFDCLEAAHVSTDDPYCREHVTPWMQRTDGIKRVNMVDKEDKSDINLCVDHPADIDRLEELLANGTLKEIEYATRH